MNRVAIHESAAGGLSPADLIGVAHRAGFDSIGLRVSHSPGADRWWQKGAGAEELRMMVDRLLVSRVSVLDVGRIDLGAETTESARHVLDLAARLGARYVTAAATADLSTGEATDLFGSLVRDADVYQLIPLLVPQQGTAVHDETTALEIHRAVGGAVMLNVSTSQSAVNIESAMLEAGNRLGYLRLSAEELDVASDDSTAGLLATVPAHVPIAVGSTSASASASASALTNPQISSDDLEVRAARWWSLIDRMLEHPVARAAREAL